MKKICFVTTTLLSYDVFLKDITDYMNRNGDFDIFLISSPDKEFEKKIPGYVTFIPVKMKRGIDFSFLFIIIRLIKIFRKEKFDLVQYATPNASFYSSVALKFVSKTISFYTLWGFIYLKFKGFKKIIFKIMEKTTCFLSDKIEVVSQSNLEHGLKEKILNESKASVLFFGSTNGVNFEKFNINNKVRWNEEIRKELGIEKSAFIIGYAGRINRDKGVLELLRVHRKLVDIHRDIFLLLIGEIDEISIINEDIFKWAKDCNKVIFVQFKNNIEEYLAAMDIFILLSHREGFGSVLIESQAMGVPVISTRIPGPEDAICENESGFFVDLENEEEAYSKVLLLYNNKLLREKMGLNGLKFVSEKFDRNILFPMILESRSKIIEEGYLKWENLYR